MSHTSLKGICFGEVLWDRFPEKYLLGGAPANTAYHATRMGADARIISAVGEDMEGSAIIGELTKADVKTKWVTTLEGETTGAVDIALNDNGDASYTIREDVAWDRIQVTDAMVRFSKKSGFIVYGSLALRGENNRTNLQKLLNAGPKWKVMDLNLRAPFDDRDLVLEWASKANVLKLNDTELFEMCQKPFSEAAIDGCIRELAGLTGVGRIFVTRGEKGAVYYDRGNWYEGSSKPVQVVDTVGAGDAFTASIILFLCSPDPITDISDWLSNSCRRSAWVVTQEGAMPRYPIEGVH